MTQPLPWSHSSLIGFETCPRQYEELKVLHNFTDTKNEASIWGDEFHTAAETYLKGGELGERFAQYRDYLDTFKAVPGTLYAERKYALTRQLQPCDFFAPDVWCRGIIDVLILDRSLAHVDDHKTGKRKKDMQQLIVFALLVFYHHAEVNTCKVSFRWLKTNEVDVETFYRHQTPELWETLIPKLQRYKRAFDTGIFPPKPSGLCKKHCAVATCEYFGAGMYRG